MNETSQWVKAAHVIAFMLWTGGLACCLALLHAQVAAPAGGRKALASAARKAALIMDIGALLAIVAGLYLAVGFSPYNAFKDGGWLHVKSTLVVGLLGVHVFTRIKVRKFRNGDISSLSGLVIPLTLALIAVIAVFGVVKPLR